jgi:hypothetical protein
VTGQPGTLGSRSGWQAVARLGGGVRVGSGRTTASSARTRDDDPGRIRDRWIEQLDLDTDDRMDPHRLGGGHEPDGAVQPGVVRDRERAETDLGGPLDEVVRRGRAVEEREVGVAMELGVGDLCHDFGPRSMAGCGPSILEHLF